MQRRTYLLTASLAATTAIAGCTGGGDDAGNETGDDSFGDFDPDTPAEEPPELAGTWEDFERTHHWEVVEGQLENDRERFYEGSQSAHLSVEEAATNVRIVRTLDAPLDCSEVVPGMAMASSGQGAPSIQLWDERGNKAEYRQEVDEHTPFVRRNFGLSKMEGDVDLGRIGEVHVIHWVGEEADGDLWVDDLYFTERSREGRIAIQFHGGYESEYERALPVLQGSTLPVTTFVPTGRIRPDDEASGDRLTEDQLAALADEGWTIGSFAHRGLRLPSVDEDERADDVAMAAEWLRDHGYEDGARFFAFPGGRVDETSYAAVQEHHDLAFAGRFPSQGHAANPHLCTRMMDPDAEDVSNLLDWTSRVGGITTLAFGQPDGDTVDALEVLLDELPEYRQEGRLSVLSLDRMSEEFVF